MILLSRIPVASCLLIFFTLHLLQLQSCEGQHVIFENIGQMAGAISYQHVKLTLNLSSIFFQFENYHSALKMLHSNISLSDPFGINNPNNFRASAAAILKDSRRLNLETIQQHMNEASDIADMVDTLQQVLPEVAVPNNIPSSSSPTHRTGRSPSFSNIKKHISRARLAINISKKIINAMSGGATGLLGLPFGIFGTFMGLYNQAQINALRRELYSTIDAHNRLVEVVSQHDQLISEIDQQVVELTNILHITLLQNPGYTSARLARIENQIKSRLNIAIHTIQQAQHRRLAVDLLSAEQLNILFVKLQEQAVLNGCQLLVQHRSDLFQLETSYFFDGADIHLLVHVPMVPTDSLLRLFKLHPFPLPLIGSHVFIPSVKDDILAISSGFHRYSAQLSGTDLLGCHVINNIYLCERHGVLNSDLNNTCLGSLYMQDFDTVKSSCNLEIHRSGEIVHQLLNNWYLVYSTSTQTVPISCFNGTQSEKHIIKGTSKIYISPGCRAHLSQHLIISDIAIKLESDLLHFEWRWDDIAMEGLTSDVIGPQLALLEANGLLRPTLSDLYELNLHQQRTPSWWTVVANFVGNVVMFVFILGLISFLIFRFIRYRRNLVDATNEAELEDLKITEQ